MSKIKNHRELRVWQDSVNLSLKLYEITEHFPKYEVFGLSSQIQRAGVSIPANISEGFGRGRMKEYLQFLRIAAGSLSEIDTLVEIAVRRHYIDNLTYNELLSEIVFLSKRLTSQRNALRNSVTSEQPTT